MQNASHLLQIEALHSKYDKHILKANIFALILIPLRLLCYFENCVCFSKTENWVKGREQVYGFADLVCGSAVWGPGFRNCVTSKDLVCKQFYFDFEEKHLTQTCS